MTQRTDSTMRALDRKVHRLIYNGELILKIHPELRITTRSALRKIRGKMIAQGAQGEIIRKLDYYIALIGYRIRQSRLSKAGRR